MSGDVQIKYGWFYFISCSFLNKLKTWLRCQFNADYFNFTHMWLNLVCKISVFRETWTSASTLTSEANCARWFRRWTTRCAEDRGVAWWKLYEPAHRHQWKNGVADLVVYGQQLTVSCLMNCRNYISYSRAVVIRCVSDCQNYGCMYIINPPSLSDFAVCICYAEKTVPVLRPFMVSFQCGRDLE